MLPYFYTMLIWISGLDEIRSEHNTYTTCIESVLGRPDWDGLARRLNGLTKFCLVTFELRENALLAVPPVDGQALHEDWLIRGLSWAQRYGYHRLLRP